MKKYILPAAFLMIAGIASAQTAAKTSTDKPVARTNKTAVKKSTVSNSVSSATPTTGKNTNSAATIKRKHHKKRKSVPASSN